VGLAGPSVEHSGFVPSPFWEGEEKQRDAGMDRQVQWFCHHITAEGLVTAEQCRELAKAFADGGHEPDLEAFAQAVFDNGLLTDTHHG
jgi:hypothetical protein